MGNIRLRTRLLCEARVRSGAQSYWERRAPGGAILTYHGVVEQLRDPLLDLFNIDLDTFEAHLRFFRENREVVPLRHIVEAVRRGESIPSDWVAITMDDALHNQVTLAADVLDSHGCPWTLGVPAGLVGTGRTIWTYEFRFLLLTCWRFESIPSPLDSSLAFATRSDAERRIAAQRIHQLLMVSVDDRRREEYLEQAIDRCGRKEFLERLGSDGRFLLADWEQLSALQASGVELASHGWNHRPQNATLRQESAAEEIVASRRCMAEKLGRPPAGFVLPGGQIAAETADRLSSAGYEYCLTTEPRRVGVGVSAMRIPRFDAEYPLAVLRRHLLKH